MKLVDVAVETLSNFWIGDDGEESGVKKSEWAIAHKAIHKPDDYGPEFAKGQNEFSLGWAVGGSTQC